MSVFYDIVTALMKNTSVKIYLAPLRGITLLTFRNAFHRHFHGIDLAVTPFIPTVNSEKIKPSLIKDVDLHREQSIPVIPQIIGNRSDDIVKMCLVLHNLGHNEINWNLGCPHKPVTRKMRGAGLLPHPDIIKTVLDRVFKEPEIAFSIKTRLGLKNPDELYGLAYILNDYPLKNIIIHPRTASQMYSGTVDINRFDQCMKALNCPVVFNGDIRNTETFTILQKRFPNIYGWMIGRWIIANPFLAEDIHGGNFSRQNKKDRMAAFLDDLLAEYSSELYGPAHILGRMKELWKYLSLSFTRGSVFLTKIQHSTSVDAYKKIIEQLLEEENIID